MPKKSPAVDSATRTKIVDLRRGGMSLRHLATRFELPLEVVADVVDEYLREVRAEVDPRLEIDRLDRMLAGLWATAAAGDSAAVDRVLKISERRDRLRRQVAPSEPGEMRQGFDESVAGLTLTPADQSLVTAGRTIANRIDTALLSGEGQEITKALYLVPHLLNVLRELEATPKARSDHDDGDKPAKGKEPVGGGKKITNLRDRYLAVAGE